MLVVVTYFCIMDLIIIHFTSQTAENGETQVDVLSDVAMSNAYMICHNVQVHWAKLFPLAIKIAFCRIWCILEAFIGKGQRKREKERKRKDEIIYIFSTNGFILYYLHHNIS